jgi:hypothetical protein
MAASRWSSGASGLATIGSSRVCVLFIYAKQWVDNFTHRFGTVVAAAHTVFDAAQRATTRAGVCPSCSFTCLQLSLCAAMSQAMS